MTVLMRDSQPHFRKVIRHRAVLLLKDNLDVGGRVFPSRPLNLFKYELPACLIYFTDEEGDHQNSAPRNYLRTLHLVTEVLHNISTEIEMQLDDFFDSRAFEIEHAFLDDRYLGLAGCVEDVVYERTEVGNFPAEGDRQIASMRIFFNIKYRTDFHYTGQLDEFLRFNAEYNLHISDDADEAEAEDNVIIRTE